MVAFDVRTFAGRDDVAMPVSPKTKQIRDKDKEQMQRVGERIRELRTKKQLALEDLAALSRVRYHALYSYEHGERIPSVFAAMRIATALGVTVEDLFNGLMKAMRKAAANGG